MAQDPTDPDGDSEMTSSVGSLHSGHEGGTGARTPTGIAQAPASATELSPPGSQTHHSAPPLSDMRASVEVRKGSVTDKAGEWESGIAAWKSKRAQDDVHRALEFVTDKDFSLDEFGDPFDERDLEEKLF
ncbi:uncharacterized protein N7511_005606 [Penicillium nucicola]|uniref:uncharacterized protein n=1 Tax=Penicillium nucicola TaxID=1850975 RepID=UPI002545A546|nr:uncharacterized protein N7511_005606 [Penicillium nucicola]KAJ5762224.1 hypothetical protein N7511_005606 [Penicillium nucicola]